jgi:alkylation response protein AidB-like acyl-CoA dehydrogenase
MMELKAPDVKERGRAPSPAELQAQLDAAAAALEAGLARNDLDEFYSVFRSTQLPFMAALHQGDAPRLAPACCRILHRLGGISPAVALAVENQLYVTSALATFPIQEPAFEARREHWLRRMEDRRLLVANSNSRVHSDKLGSLGVTARREGDGFRITGSAAYMSLATQSDLVVFLTLIEGEGPAIFVTRLRDNPGIEIGPFLFPRAMLDSDTRRITFHDLAVSQDELLIGGRTEEMSQFNLFELVWHQLLIPALYLGAAARAIEEARLFLRSVRGHDDRPLAELDGMVVDTGRLVIRYRAAWAVVRQAAGRLGELAQHPLEKTSLADLFELASLAKHTGTVCAEEVVTAVRRIIGARSFAGATPHPIERLSQEIPFGPLGPEVNALIERRIGRRALQETPFTGPVD